MAHERDAINLRMLGERMIVEALLRALIERCDAPAFLISVDDGDGDGRYFAVNKSRCVQGIMAGVFAVDEARLVVEWEESKRWGEVFLVMGNEAHEVVSNYSVSLDKYIPHDLADSFERIGVLATIAKERASGDYPPSRFKESWKRLWGDIEAYHLAP